MNLTPKMTSYFYFHLKATKAFPLKGYNLSILKQDRKIVFFSAFSYLYYNSTFLLSLGENVTAQEINCFLTKPAGFFDKERRLCTYHIETA